MRLRLQARLFSPDILRQVLPGRRAALGRVDDSEARRNEEAFSARSASYREAVTAGPSTGSALEVAVVDGIAWRVPAHSAPRTPLEEIL